MKFYEKTICIELTAPLHIGSGERQGASDAGVVRDFNGLPGIPGSTLQGILRATIRDQIGESAEREIFGYPGTSDSPDKGRGGRLWISWGVIHDHLNCPQHAPIVPQARDSDSVLRDAAFPTLRDHVCLNEQGAAKHRGKFDELVVSPGHRFTFQLRFAKTGREEDDGYWEKILGIIEDPGLRIGGKTRRGLGGFNVLGSASQDSSILTVVHEAVLCPESFWMFGGGLSEDTDSAPVESTRIIWSNESKGAVERVWLIPGSAVKGALVHRTQFHANRVAGIFADADRERDSGREQQVKKWMRSLFGSIDGDSASAGRVFISDIYLPCSDVRPADIQNHVAINPYTGGAKDTALYDDRPLLAGNVSVPIQIAIRDQEGVNKEARDALGNAFDDLCEGRLPLGAHAGRGYGVFLKTQTEAA